MNNFEVENKIIKFLGLKDEGLTELNLMMGVGRLPILRTTQQYLNDDIDTTYERNFQLVPFSSHRNPYGIKELCIIPIALMQETIKELKETVEQSGPCDHAANICVCGLNSLIAQLKEYVQLASPVEIEVPQDGRT